MLGDKICFSCRENKFKQGKTQFKEEKKGEQIFQDAEKSYIPIDIENKQQFRDIRVRELSVQELCIGRIIIHTLLMLALSFSNEKQVMELVLGKKNFDADYKEQITDTISYLCVCYQYDWSTLKKSWCVNDEKVLQIIQSIIIGILREPAKFSADKLTSDTSRKSLETDFKQIC